MVTSYGKCKICRGAKELLGLGMVSKKCSACKGVGYCEYEDEARPFKPETQEAVGFSSTDSPLRGDSLENAKKQAAALSRITKAPGWPKGKPRGKKGD